MKNTIYIAFLLCIIIACKKDNSNNNVPSTPVDIYLYTNNPSFINVSTVGGWVYITGGVRGILVYRKSNTEFMAYDRNCTFQSSEPCATIVVDNTNIAATDTCCNSRFSIYDGSVFQGPASVPLRAYSTSFDGSVLHIYN
jgi:nitrite reductase/ring-hydroxylating ferredoxin subunit